uniref:Ovule protein n=1 Tax=Steinernema glaseri TaxID=37863 RepID=A0A1I8AGN4_9BILA
MVPYSPQREGELFSSSDKDQLYFVIMRLWICVFSNLFMRSKDGSLWSDFTMVSVERHKYVEEPDLVELSRNNQNETECGYKR